MVRQLPKRKDIPAPKTYGKQSTKRRRVAQLPFIDLTDDINMSFVPDKFSSDPLTSTRPTSQKAATMAAQPSQEDVMAVCAFTSCDESTAIRYLKAKQNDMQAAVNALLDGEDIAKLEQGTTWDESVMDADRDGNQNLQPLGTSAAPTRGPSPAPSLGLNGPTTKAEEDDQLAAAVAMSQGFGYKSQESGVVRQDGSEQHFGPATRAQYEERNWGLTILPSTAQEIVPDVPVIERKHKDFEPRSLKYLPDGDYTPNLITICHAVPIAREAFLMREHAEQDYGSDADWWHGAIITIPRIVHTLDGSAVEPDTDKYDEFLSECQRLMAFLASSKRSYASVGALNNTEIIKDIPPHSKSGGLLEYFLHSWTSASMSKHEHDPNQRAQLANIFTTIVDTNAPQGMQDSRLSVIDITVKSQDGDDRPELYEHLDNLLWDTDPDDKDRPDNYITRPADIMVMKASSSNPAASQLGLVVPASFYMDKYLEKNIGATKAVRDDMAREKGRIRKISEIENKLRNWQHPKKNAQLGAQKLLEYTLGHFSGANRRKVDEADKKNESSLSDIPQPAYYSDISAKLEKVVASINKKLELLAAEKERSRKAIADMSKSSFPGGKEEDCRHRYTLRGVATKPNITYILHPLDPNDRRLSPASDDDTTPQGYQWWRVEYKVSGNTASLNTAKAADYDVLRAVELEHNSALLVYASDDATSLDDFCELPRKLQEFVEADNALFEQELAQGPPSYEQAFEEDMRDIPRQSIERSDSVNSLTAVHGDDDEADPPGYMEDDINRAGLGYGQSSNDPPPVDIILSETEEAAPEVEMQEKAHEPLLPRPRVGSDTNMGGMGGQDDGMGGNA
ncbi:Hypothetical predicted protein [Lecanosticta acicola]|uniref:Ubiquitin interaction motif protein n=1 Tax=Lecanosticta acicola TaxID=111012 RepID=A0AAI9EAQ4_9PEZI|nr:Hypothetical predicted protein [Lecanosticta acicola]